MDTRALTINRPMVVYETIDGETILIHMGTGTYYSLEGVGSEVWALLERGLGEPEIVSRAQQRYDSEPAAIEAGVVTLLDQLTEEDLVVAQASPSASAPASATSPEAAVSDFDDAAGAGPFTAPVLQKYTDMQEFMLVDPLHDVDEHAGWPHAKAG